MISLDVELVGVVRLVGVDSDRLGDVLEDCDDGVVVILSPALL